MPRDLAGNYTLPLGNPVVTDTIIESTWANSTMSDVATQLNGVVTRDGKLGPTTVFQVLHGAVGAPGLAFNGDVTTGFYQASAGRISFAVSGVNVGTITAASFTFTAACMPAVAADPTSGNQLTRKSYVDAAVATGGGAFVPLAGGTMTGNLSIAKIAPELILNTTDTTNQNTGILIQNTGVLRWRHLLQGLETGGDTGSFFSFRAYTDAGTFAGSVLNLYRDLTAQFSGNVTAPTFAGDLTGDVTGHLTGNVTGNVTGTVTGSLVGNASGTAGSLATARNINGVGFNGTANINIPSNIVADATNISRFLMFSGGTGNSQAYTDATGLTYNPSTNILTVGSEVIASSNIPTDDFSLGYRKVVRSVSTAITRLYCGFCKSLSAGVTIPSATFEAGDAMSFYNNSGSAWNLTRGGGLTMYNSAGVNSATISIPAHTRVTIWFESASECSVG